MGNDGRAVIPIPSDFRKDNRPMEVSPMHIKNRIGVKQERREMRWV